MEYSVENYPVGKFRFRVECDGIAENFSEVTGFDASVESTEYREGSMKTTALKLAGLRKYGNITLKRAVSKQNAGELWNWWTIADGEEAKRCDLTIHLLNNKGTTAEDAQIVASWTVKNAFPVKYTAPDFDAKSSEAAIETIELAHEGMIRQKK